MRHRRNNGAGVADPCVRREKRDVTVTVAFRFSTAVSSTSSARGDSHGPRTDDFARSMEGAGQLADLPITFRANGTARRGSGTATRPPPRLRSSGLRERDGPARRRRRRSNFPRGFRVTGRSARAAFRALPSDPADAVPRRFGNGDNGRRLQDRRCAARRGSGYRMRRLRVGRHMCGITRGRSRIRALQIEYEVINSGRSVRIGRFPRVVSPRAFRWRPQGCFRAPHPPAHME